jgi:excisionase family DNA binding protein
MSNTLNGNGPLIFQEPEMFMTRQECADALGISLRTCANWIKDGRIPASRLSPRCIRIRKSSLIKVMDKFATTRAE